MASETPSEAKKVLSVLAKATDPMSNKQIAEQAELESKKVSSAMSALKKEGFVDSPVRCKYAITPSGKKALKG
ncbi:MAG: winged helix-turn-helix transcriptional regulator [Desulfarculaceae bacterium]|nr:winged helix-turn-helix transcriptional regulator [Desulfarculaceae bacterium]MCF8048849.1 winged helix-turn-helix transcriptional regulator [Desulfarculaceae bacterium]MCF8065950.1 winged helix-turn-helix transcriptional regulator [Desulfarculaceae bacterium]MCF8098751.1 winged helix-turn-helix transcriptional regulator [Desulfarculaceae bacterium]MCF8123975.1 winged helix-turn-helix transcriptional regulator [Desulfarculaceae bacterium]